MTAAEFRNRLAEYPCYQREFARYVGANERTVRRWAEGQQDIPKWVSVVLDLMEQLQAAEAQKPRRVNSR
jgi:DNA-binding transcriptional regulator YiaG